MVKIVLIEEEEEEGRRRGKRRKVLLGDGKSRILEGDFKLVLRLVG